MRFFSFFKKEPCLLCSQKDKSIEFLLDGTERLEGLLLSSESERRESQSQLLTLLNPSIKDLPKPVGGYNNWRTITDRMNKKRKEVGTEEVDGIN